MYIYIYIFLASGMIPREGGREKPFILVKFTRSYSPWIQVAVTYRNETTVRTVIRARPIFSPPREKRGVFSRRATLLFVPRMENASEGDEQVVNISHARVRTRTRQF